MSFKTIVNNSRTWWAHASAHGAYRIRLAFHARPLASASVLVAAGLLIGVAGRSAAGMAQVSLLQAKAEQRDAELDQVRRGAQQEINAMAARLGELQAQANRLNALGERLTEVGQLEDGEFDFQGSPGQGGAGPVGDMPLEELLQGLDEVERQFAASGKQLAVMEALLFDLQVENAAVPAGAPVRRSYITSSFGHRADPFGRGRQFHKGIDFNAKVGDPVMAVADGVVSFAGTRSGYGHTVEVDHGNGYVTRYAHNSRLTVKVGDLVRAGQEVAKAGSSGRSTGAHVHFEVWENGRVVNPRKFLASSRAPVARRGRG